MWEGRGGGATERGSEGQCEGGGRGRERRRKGTPYGKLDHNCSKQQNRSTAHRPPLSSGPPAGAKLYPTPACLER